MAREGRRTACERRLQGLAGWKEIGHQVGELGKMLSVGEEPGNMWAC